MRDIDSLLRGIRDAEIIMEGANYVSALYEPIHRARRKVVAWFCNRYYQDYQDYIGNDEVNWACRHGGLTLNFPVNRERMFIVVNGKPIVAQEGCADSVTTKRYQFASACLLAEGGADVYCIHNHPNGNVEPSDMDLEVARLYPEIRHYTTAQQSDGTVLFRQYDKDGVIEDAQGVLNESNA